MRTYYLGDDMLQMVEGEVGYVVEFDTMPELPITGAGMEGYYAEALTQAIVTGTVTEPGKYFIIIDWATEPHDWHIFTVEE